MRHRTKPWNGTQLLGPIALAICAVAGVTGCASPDRSASTAGVDDRSAAPASLGEGGTTDIAGAVLLEEEARHRRTPPPRLHGKSFTTSAPSANGTIHRVDIRIRDGDAETRVDGRVVPRERVLVHRRGYVEILGEDGNPQIGFNLPRGMTGVANPTGR